MSRITLKDVAAEAGVSYQTVSKLLNDKANITAETESRIWEAIDKLGYRPNVSARNLRTQSSNLIGYGWRQADQLSPRPVLDDFLFTAAHTARQRGFHLLTFAMSDDQFFDASVYEELYGRRQVEGFILADTNYDDPRIARLMELDIPFVSFGRANDAWDFCWVDVDGEAGLRVVTDHLIRQGHEKIAFLTWEKGSMAGADREAGYVSAMHTAALPINPAWIVRGENTVEFGSRGLQTLLNLPQTDRPTAVACVTDLVAIGAMNRAAALGLQVGRDLAVTGFDNVPMSEFLYPPLTTVSQPIAEVGEQMIAMLFALLDGEPIEQKGVLLKPQLVIRESG